MAQLPHWAARVLDAHDETGPDGRRAHTVQKIAEEFGVSRPTIDRHLRHEVIPKGIVQPAGHPTGA